LAAIPVALDTRALSLIGEVLGLLDLDELCEALLHSLREAVPAEWCALNEVPADFPQTISLTDPPVPREIHEAFARYGTQNPIAEYFLRTGEGRATRFSDLVTRRELHRLEVYRHVYQPLATEYQIAFTLPGGSRTRGPDPSRRARRDRAHPPTGADAESCRRWPHRPTGRHGPRDRTADRPEAPRALLPRTRGQQSV
jgi:hypothetical protein